MQRLLLVIICLFCANFCSAQNITTYKLDNGHTLVVEQIKSNPVVTIDTWINTGSINEDDSNSGISHFLEHLFFKGTEKHPTGEFDRILESKGAVTNAATSKDFTHYYITISSKYFQEAMILHADMLLHPQIPRNEMEKERKVVLEEISKDLNSPSKLCYENLNSMLYTVHPYKRKVIGNSKIIENVSRKTILDYYNKFYTPSNMVTLVVGDVDPENVYEIVKQCFNTPQKKTYPVKHKQEPKIDKQKRNIAYMPTTNTSYMMLGFRTTDIEDSDSYALDVLANILGEGVTSKLYQSLKEQKQIVNSVSASNTSMKEDGFFMISANFQPQNMEKTENAIIFEIEKIKKYGITDSELKIAKNMIETDTYYARESVSNIAQELGYTIILTGGMSYYNNYINKINKVTASDVERVANKYLNIDNSVISFVLPEISKEKVVKPVSIKHETKFISEYDKTSKYILDNNATVLITNNNYNDIVAISMCFKGGKFYENKKGTALLYSDLLLKGTKKYSAIELSTILDENGIKLVFSPTTDSFTATLLTTKKQLNIALDILSEIINNSVFDDLEIEKVKSSALNKIKQSKDSPLTVALDSYKEMMYKDSKYSNSFSILEKSIPSITRNDILKYHSEIINPNNLIISINGDVKNDEIFGTYSNMFKKKNNNIFNYKNYAIPKITTKRNKTIMMKNQQTAWLLLGWQTSGFLNKKDYVTLQVINTLLGSGMSSRLFKSLREQEGLAYQVGSSYTPNILTGSMLVYIGTNPATLNESKQIILSEMQKLKTQFVSRKELQDAQNRLIGSFVILLETNLDKASAIGSFETVGFGYNFIDEYINLINSVTVSDIVEVANKYFNDNYVESIVTNVK